MKKKYDIAALKKRVFIRDYRNIQRFGDNVTFEDWMDTIEVSLSMGHGEYPAVMAINKKEHSRLLKQIETIASKYEDIIELFHQEPFKNLLEEIKFQNQIMQPARKRDGRFPIPGTIAMHLLNGMEISKRETGGYELFRMYYYHATENDFNLPTRAEKLANGYWPDGTKFNPKYYKLEKGYHSYFPLVPKKTQENEDWVRSMRQTLRKIIKDEKS